MTVPKKEPSPCAAAVPPARRLLALNATVLIAVASTCLTGCATHGTSTPAPDEQSPAFTEAPSAIPTVVPSAFVDGVKPAPLVGGARTTTLTSSPWKLLAVSDDGRTLTLMASQGGGCDTPGGMQVVQTQKQVTLTSLYEKGEPPPGGACAAYLATPVWSVRLTSPLGARPLVHAPAAGSPL